MSVPRPRSSRRLAVGLLVLAAAGCATLPPLPREPISADAQHALMLLRARAAALPTLRTLAELEVQRGPERLRLQGVLLARPPASVRFEALSPLGQPVLLATVTEDRLVAYDATTNEAVVGPATVETTARVLGLPFEPEDLVAVLSGHAAVPLDIRRVDLVAADEAGPSLELRGRVNRRRIWMDLDSGIVRQLELGGGRAEALVRYDRDPDGTLRGIDLSAMLGWITASVRYREPQRGVDVPDDTFVLTLPNTAKIQHIR